MNNNDGDIIPVVPGHSRGKHQCFFQPRILQFQATGNAAQCISDQMGCTIVVQWFFGVPQLTVVQISKDL